MGEPTQDKSKRKPRKAASQNQSQQSVQSKQASQTAKQNVAHSFTKATKSAMKAAPTKKAAAQSQSKSQSQEVRTTNRHGLQILIWHLSIPPRPHASLERSGYLCSYQAENRHPIMKTMMRMRAYLSISVEPSFAKRK